MAPLNYLQFKNGSSTFIGLIDSGSQLNLVDSNVLPFLKFQPRPKLISTMAGVQGHISKIENWICFKVDLGLDITTEVTAAVVRGVPCSILLGQPFLLSIKAHVDSYNATLTIKSCQLPLLQRHQPPSPLCTNISAGHSATSQEVLDSRAPSIPIEGSNLTLKQHEQVCKLLGRYHNLWRDDKIGRARHIEHRIILRSDHPIQDKPRTYAPEQHREIREQVNSMLKLGIIRLSKSSYFSQR